MLLRAVISKLKGFVIVSRSSLFACLRNTKRLCRRKMFTDEKLAGEVSLSIKIATRRGNVLGKENTTNEIRRKVFFWLPQSADDQGGLTEYKLKMLGTREGVDDAFAREQQNKAQGKPRGMSRVSLKNSSTLQTFITSFKKTCDGRRSTECVAGPISE